MADPLQNGSQATPQTPLGNAGRVLSSQANAAVAQQSIARAFQLYRGQCECGEHLENNCAHYLSDAFIRAGYSQLDGGHGGYAREVNGRVVCKAGRPIRAREMREWFQSMATTTENGEPIDDQHWAVFQLDTGPDRYWGGHVVIHAHSGANYTPRGTGDYPNWAIQEHYTW